MEHLQFGMKEMDDVHFFGEIPEIWVSARVIEDIPMLRYLLLVIVRGC